MIDHMGLPVSSFTDSRRFYERALQPLGMVDSGVDRLF